MNFVPSSGVLKNYAKILVNFALGKGKGIKKKDVVYLQFDYPALPLALKVYEEILMKGGLPILKISDESFSKMFFEKAKDFQLEFFPKDFYRSLIKTIDHKISLIADKDPLLLSEVKPYKIMKANKNKGVIRKWLFEKEDAGEFTWTLALYGTKGMAGQVGLSLEEFWAQIKEACFLRDNNPVKKWRDTSDEISRLKDKLNALPIKKIHILAKDTDLWISLGKDRQFIGGGGANIPSFEIFTSPDWRGTEGHIYFDMPLFRYGNLIENVHLEFKEGRVVKAKAEKNEKLLVEMIKQKNADKIGEFSLTDKRFSHIDRFMANTLYDENHGGRYGNSHIAVGASYHDTYTEDPKKLKENDWKKLGFNESAEHCDIISTLDKTVEAVMKDGSKKIIYKSGVFTI